MTQRSKKKVSSRRHRNAKTRRSRIRRSKNPKRVRTRRRSRRVLRGASYSEKGAPPFQGRDSNKSARTDKRTLRRRIRDYKKKYPGLSKKNIIVAFTPEIVEHIEEYNLHKKDYIDELFRDRPDVEVSLGENRLSNKGGTPPQKTASIMTHVPRLKEWLNMTRDHLGKEIPSMQFELEELLINAAGDAGNFEISRFAEVFPPEKLEGVLDGAGLKGPVLKKLYRRLHFELHYPLWDEAAAKIKVEANKIKVEATGYDESF